MRAATKADIPHLLALVKDFYEESGHVLDRRRAEAAFTSLLADPRLGRVWLVERDSVAVGHIVVTFVFAMEYGGLVAWVDDFYVRPASRDLGLGTAALAQVVELCAGLGVRAVSVEVGADNVVAQAVYRSTGFAPIDRRLMTLGLADPANLG
jgi:GNAT superfamily N-acetyltransferase